MPNHSYANPTCHGISFTIKLKKMDTNKSALIPLCLSLFPRMLMWFVVPALGRGILVWLRCSSAQSWSMRAPRPLNQSAWCRSSWGPSRLETHEWKYTWIILWHQLSASSAVNPQVYGFIVTYPLNFVIICCFFRSWFWWGITASWVRWWCVRRQLRQVCPSLCLSVW